MRVYITGFMGSGKTTVGRLLAESIGWVFCDLDSEIERIEGKAIQEIFEQSGEAYFRELERTYLQKLQSDSLIVATGGGCFIHNRDWMLENGIVIFLEVPFEPLVRRVGGDPSRPLWKNAKKLYGERKEQYRKAQITIEASGPPESVVSEILKATGLQRIEK